MSQTGIPVVRVTTRIGREQGDTHSPKVLRAGDARAGPWANVAAWSARIPLCVRLGRLPYQVAHGLTATGARPLGLDVTRDVGQRGRDQAHVAQRALRPRVGGRVPPPGYGGRRVYSGRGCLQGMTCTLAPKIRIAGPRDAHRRRVVDRSRRDGATPSRRGRTSRWRKAGRGWRGCHCATARSRL